MPERLGVAPTIRAATPADVSAMVALSAEKRRAYAAVLPVFWRPAADADARQTAWFAHLFARETTLALVAEGASAIDGFLVGILHPAPPVYDPGGLTCTVDDFCVRDEGCWSSAGAALLAEVRRRARERGAVQVVVVCGVHDDAKRSLLDSPALSPASVWFTGPA